MAAPNFPALQAKVQATLVANGAIPCKLCYADNTTYSTYVLFGERDVGNIDTRQSPSLFSGITGTIAFLPGMPLAWEPDVGDTLVYKIGGTTYTRSIVKYKSYQPATVILMCELVVQ